MADKVPFLQCANPHHPGSNRRTMECVRETDQFCVFMCRQCMDVLHLESIQVKTRTRFKQEIRKQLKKEGRLMTSAPQIVRRFGMEETLRKESK